MRAVIYARYSTDMQREASIADQIEICRRYIERNGWTLTGHYDDAARTGTTTRRPGFLRLLADAEAGMFDIVVCEALDRLGRKLADIAATSDRLIFARVQLHSANVGHLTPMHIGILGTMSQMFVLDVRDKVRRGQLGRARAGRMPGGLAFGYDVVPPAPGAKESGERRINAAEAATVVRIFTDYAAGVSPRQLAKTLNNEGVPGPHGRVWIDTTIRGQLDRGTGLLNNTVYIGRLSWDRCSYVKNPKTGNRVARVNPTSQWEVTEVPQLRIIDQTLWEKVKARQSEVRLTMSPPAATNTLNGARRGQFLLSGLLTCGACGGSYTIIGADRYGCATRRGKGTCTNAVTIMRQPIETRVLGALKDRMLTPEMVSEFVTAFAEECARHRRETAGIQTDLIKQKSAVEQSLRGILKAIESGAWNETLRKRLTELECREVEIEEALSTAAVPSPVALHPDTAGLYATKVGKLADSLNDPAVRIEAAETIRALIERVVLTPDADAPNGLAAELQGDVALILARLIQRGEAAAAS